MLCLRRSMQASVMRQELLYITKQESMKQLLSKKWRWFENYKKKIEEEETYTNLLPKHLSYIWKLMKILCFLNEFMKAPWKHYEKEMNWRKYPWKFMKNRVSLIWWSVDYVIIFQSQISWLCDLLVKARVNVKLLITKSLKILHNF